MLSKSDYIDKKDCVNIFLVKQLKSLSVEKIKKNLTAQIKGARLGNIKCSFKSFLYEK